MKVWAVAVVVVALLGLTLLGSLVLAVPMVTDDQIRMYAEVAKEMEPAKVPWQAIIALDAVRYHQDFSQVTRAKIRQTAELLVVCRKQVVDEAYDFRLDYVGETVRHPIKVPVRGRMEWTVTARAGRVRAELQDSLDRPVVGNLVEPGYYTLLVYALAAPAPYHVEVKVIGDQKSCYGRTLDEVMDDLHFSPFDREMAKQLVNAFEEAGPVEFRPNPDSPYTWPVAGLITSRFGYRVSPTGGQWEMHSGVDIAAAEGTPVRVADAGVVVSIGWSGNYGRLIVVQHDGFQTWYGHLSRVDVRPGERVGRGDPIGAVGSTGRSTGPHLHFEWRVEDRSVDPLQAFR